MGFDLIEIGQRRIENYPLAAQDEDPFLNETRWQRR
jgi:hypothetical protein